MKNLEPKPRTRRPPVYEPSLDALKGGIMKLVRLVPPGLLVPALAFAASLSIVAPASGASCVRQYVQCLVAASDLETWWERTAAGLDCYLDAVACVRAAYF